MLFKKRQYTYCLFLLEEIKMKKFLQLSMVVGLLTTLVGCGNETAHKSTPKKEAKISGQSAVSSQQPVCSNQSASEATSHSQAIPNNNQAFGKTLSDKEFYILAYMKSHDITFESMEEVVTKHQEVFSKENNQDVLKNQSNEEPVYLKGVTEDSVTIAKFKEDDSKSRSEWDYQDFTYKKKDLIDTYLKNEADVNQLSQLVQMIQENSQRQNDLQELQANPKLLVGYAMVYGHDYLMADDESWNNTTYVLHNTDSAEGFLTGDGETLRGGTVYEFNTDQSAPVASYPTVAIDGDIVYYGTVSQAASLSESANISEILDYVNADASRVQKAKEIAQNME